jgi:hypothetical protein
VFVDVSKGFTRYDSLQFQLRRRLSQGVSFDVNYAFSKRWISKFESLRIDRYLAPSVDAVPHALKFTTTYDLPIGQGRRFGHGMNAWVDGLVGGWSLDVTGRLQSGRLLDFGNVRVVGMSLDQLQDAIQYRIVKGADGVTRVFNLPQDIIDNTIRAFSVNVDGYTREAPAGRYLAPPNDASCIQQNLGDCAPRNVIVSAPMYTRFDASAKKTVRTGGRTNLVIEVDVLNVFNAINFNPVISTVPNEDAYRVTSSYSDVTGTFDPGSRVGQLVIRWNF